MSSDIHDFTPDEEEQLLNEIIQKNSAFEQNRANVTVDMGIALDDLIAVAPNVDTQFLADIAQGTSEGWFDIDEAANFVLDLQAAELQKAIQLEQEAEQAEQGKNWFERLVRKPAYDKIKEISRFGLASLQFYPDMINNVYTRAAAQQRQRRVEEATMLPTSPDYGLDPERVGTPNYVPPETPFWEGWFSSTDLGQYFSGRDMGEGFFLSGEAKEKQESEALRYRGGHIERTVVPESIVWDPKKRDFVIIPKQRTGTRTVASSFGRATASVLADPGSREYHLISGALDFTLQGLAPAAPGAKPLARAVGRTAEQVPTLRFADGTVAFSDKVAYRGMNGLRNLGTPYINRGKVEAWLDSRAGRNFRKIIEETDNYSDMRRILPNADITTVQRLVDDAIDDESTLKVLQEEMGFATGLRSTADVNWSRWSSVKQNVMRNPMSRTVGLERGFSRAPGQELSVGLANDIEKTITAKDIEDWLIIAKVPFEDVVDEAGNVTQLGRKNLMNRVMRALSTDPGDTYQTILELQDVFVDAFVSMGMPRAMIKETFDSFQETLATVNRFGDITAEGAADLHGLLNVHILAENVDGRWATVRPGDEFASAMFDSEHLRHNLHMPPPDEIIRATSPYRWLFEAGSLTRSAKRMLNKRAIEGLTEDEIIELEASWMDWMNGGKLRSGFALVDMLQNSVFKRLVLMGQAYVNRAAIESMARQSFAPGIRSGVQHPFDTITAAITNPKIGRYLGTLEGDVFSMVDVRYLDEAYAEFIEGTNAVIAGEIVPSGRAVMSWQGNAWTSRVPGDPEFRKAFQDNIYLLANDRLTRIYAEFGVDEIIQRAKAGDKETVQALRDLEYRMTSSKWEEVDPQGNVVEAEPGNPNRWKPKFFDPQGNVIEDAVRQHIELYVGERFRKFTKGNADLEEIVRNGADGGRFLDPASGRQVYAFVDPESAAKLRRGQVGGYGKEFTDIVNALPDDFFPPVMKGRVTVPVRKGLASPDPRLDKTVAAYDRATTFFFREIAGRQESWLNRSPVFRKYYFYSVDALLDDLAPGESVKIVQNMEIAYRAETARELTMLQRAEQLSNGRYKVADAKRPITPERYQRRLAAAQKKMDNLDSWQATPNRPYAFDPRWGARYMGSRELFDEVVGRATGKIVEDGTRTLEEVSTASKGFALSETRRLLYDVSESGNLAEAFTIIAPFVKAWKEGVTAWPLRLLTNPERTRRIGITYQGLEESDIDGDGRGLIYKDPNTGAPVFSMPLPGGKDYLLPAAVTGGVLTSAASLAMGGPAALPFAIGAATTTGVLGTQGIPGTDVPGTGIDLTYDVKSINMGLQSVLPGPGPMVQRLLYEGSKFVPIDRDIINMLMPYGVPEGDPILGNLPSWTKKVYEIVGVIAGGDGGKYMNQYTVESKIALQATGKYDTSDEQSMQQLNQDAESMALGLLIIHTAAQFQGPARPDVELIVPTKFKGDITVEDVETWFEYNVPLRYLSKEFRRMQEEDYQGAAIKFIQTFGSDAYLVMAGGSQATVEGLSATKEFGEWMDDNGDIMDALPTIYGWFAGEVGNEFDGYTYNQLILRGDRVRFDDPKQQEESAQVIVARALYQEAVRAAGVNPNIAQKITLAATKKKLEDEYPLWAASSRTIGENEQIIDQIEDAVFELDVLADNDVANVARTYLTMRREAIDLANEVRVQEGGLPASKNALSGNRFAPLRHRLRLAGFMLAATYPEFERMWNDVLFTEVDIRFDEEQ